MIAKQKKEKAERRKKFYSTKYLLSHQCVHIVAYVVGFFGVLDSVLDEIAA